MFQRLRQLGLVVALALVCAGFEWPGRIDRLIYTLEHGDAEDRRQAARKLGQHAGQDVEEALLRALEDADSAVRLEAAEAASRARIAQAAPILRDWLDDTDAAVRRAAVGGLARMQAQQAHEAAVRALADPSVEVRSVAVDALKTLKSPDAVPALLDRLEDDDLGVRLLAIEALAAIGDPRAVTPLATRTQDETPDVRAAALGALAQLADTRVVANVVACLRDDSPDVRVAAALALLTLGDATAVTALSEALHDTDSRVSRGVMVALGAIDASSARKAMVSALARPATTLAAIDALEDHARRFGHKPEVARELSDLLAAALEHALSEDGGAAELGKADAGHAPAVGRALSKVARYVSIDASLPALTRALERKVPGLSASAIEAIASSRSEAARLLLLEHVGRAQGAMLSLVLDGLATQLALGEPDGRAADPLLERLRATPLDPSAHEKLLLLLGLTGAERALPVIEPLLAATEPGLRRAAAEALGRIGAPKSAEAIVPLLRDPDAHVRLAAANALRATASLEAVRRMLELCEPRCAPEVDRHALLLALGASLGKLERARTLPSAEANRALRWLSHVIDGRDPELADRAIDALATWAPEPALKLLALGLRSPSSKRRGVVTAALARIAHPDTRGALRYAVDQGGARAAVAALSALGEVGDERDLEALLRASERKHWPLPAAATYGVARLAQRGKLRPHQAQRELCALGASREPYVRANVAAALASLAAAPCPEDGPHPVRWLEGASAFVVRVASAHWVRAAAREGRLDQALATRALARCASRDPESHVRAACDQREAQPAAKHESPLVLQALSSEGDATLKDRLVGIRFSNGLVRIGYTDKNGVLHVPLAPQGPVALESPSSLPLEPFP